MATKKSVSNAASKVGAVIVDEFARGCENQCIEVEAPDGYEWTTGNCQILVGHWFTYIKGSKAEAWEDLLQRMEFGLEPITEIK